MVLFHSLLGGKNGSNKKQVNKVANNILMQVFSLNFAVMSLRHWSTICYFYCFSLINKCIPKSSLIRNNIGMEFFQHSILNRKSEYLQGYLKNFGWDFQKIKPQPKRFWTIWFSIQSSGLSVQIETFTAPALKGERLVLLTREYLSYLLQVPFQAVLAKRSHLVAPPHNTCFLWSQYAQHE